MGRPLEPARTDGVGASAMDFNTRERVTNA
jgi:hypothetical protein